MTATTGAPPIVAPVNRKQDQVLPTIVYSISSLKSLLESAYPLMTLGKFIEAQQVFQNTLYQALLTVVEKKSDVDEVKKVIAQCKEYLIGLALEITRKATQDPKRSVELAAYFASCALQPEHLQLAIRLAMVSAFKLKCYGLALSFARRLLDLHPSPQVAESVSFV
jgi:coatomer subunit alpha